MLIACVKTGKKYGGIYVRKLHAGVMRNLPEPDKHRFVCFTDDPTDCGDVPCEPLPAELPGWWAKLGLFKLGEPLGFFDLDVVITGDLTRFLDWEGFGILKDPWLKGYGSGIMRLAGSDDERRVWEKFRPGMMTMMRGDQDWLNLVFPDQRTFPMDWFPSFKAHQITAEPPKDAMAVSFHGFPKVHQMTSGWVPRHWRE